MILHFIEFMTTDQAHYRVVVRGEEHDDVQIIQCNEENVRHPDLGIMSPLLIKRGITSPLH